MRTSLFGLLLWFFLFSSQASSRNNTYKNTDTLLLNKIQALCKNFEGDVGIYVQHLTNGNRVSINADTLFPTASMIKVPILITLFNEIEKGRLAYNQAMIYQDSLLYPGADILGSFQSGQKIALSKLVMLMITMSDNTASLWCQSLAGGGLAINRLMQQLGFKHTRVNSRTEGRKKDWQKYGWGQTTPKEIAELLIKIRKANLISPAASEEMYKVLCNIYWNNEALSQIPPWIQAASKQGAVNQSRSEVLLVNAPSGDYVLSIITNNQRDTSWHSENAGFKLIRNVSRLVWEHFEEDHAWQPAVSDRWQK